MSSVSIERLLRCGSYHEIARDLQQIMVSGGKIRVFRTAAGAVVALEDACPRCKMPRIKSDMIECGTFRRGSPRHSKLTCR